MTYRHETPLILADATARIGSNLARMRVTLDVARRILVALKPFEGKPVSKRLATAIEAALPGYVVRYEPADKSHCTFGAYQIRIWACDHDAPLHYDNRMSFTVASARNPVYADRYLSYVPDDRYARDPETGQTSGTLYPYLRYEQEIPKWEALLPDLPALVDNYNAARQAFDAAMGAFAPAGYAVFPSR